MVIKTPEGWRRKRSTVSNRWGVARVRPRRKPLRKRPSDSSSGTCRQSGGGKDNNRQEASMDTAAGVPPHEAYRKSIFQEQVSQRGLVHVERAVRCLRRHGGLGCAECMLLPSSRTSRHRRQESASTGIQGMLVAAAEFGREKASNPAVRTSHTQSR